MSKKNRSLEVRTKTISGRILNSMRMIEILETMDIEDVKIYELILIIKSNLKVSFNEIEVCRTMISIAK